MIRIAKNSEQYWKIVDSTQYCLCCYFAHLDDLAIKHQYHASGSHFFDLVIVQVSPSLQEELQIVRLPQYRFLVDGCEKLAWIGKRNLVELKAEIDGR